MKWNWGYGIAAFYLVFVGALVFQVWKSTQYDHALVSNQYYKDDLNYQQHYDKLVNTRQLQQDLLIMEDDDRKLVKLQFPNELGKLSGKVQFFCPSASGNDFTVPVRTDDRGIQLVSTEDLRQGMWRVKVDWSANGTEYYKEEVVKL